MISPLHPFLGSGLKLEGTVFDDATASLSIRRVLASVYGVLKDQADNIEFLFMTGVSKFPKTNVFSKLNNLKDLTYDRNAVDLCGYTHEEVQDNFKGYIEELSKKKGLSYSGAWEELKRWYNGYRFHPDEEQVFNPYSLMLSLQERNFKNYWLETGNLSFLINLLKKKKMSVREFENPELELTQMESLNLENLNVNALMLQTGYLTIKSREGDIYYLEYPNGEVSKAIFAVVASIHGEISRDDVALLSEKMKICLQHGRVEEMFDYMKSLIFSVPYQIVKGEASESHFHLAFHIIFKMLGFRILSEISTLNGRIDSVLETEDRIYLFEFKLNQPVSKALDQIREKEYFAPYIREKKKVMLLGVSFDSKKKLIECKELEL